MIPAPGTTLKHYRLGSPLGQGGMGAVFRAEDVRLGREVAIKFLLPSRELGPDHRVRLLREARAASALHSPHIAAIYDIGEHDEAAFIVMELVDGDPLSTLTARGPLPVVDALDVAMQAADALDEAHRHGIVHRDVKSANLMVDRRGRVKVLDFGLAKFLPADGDVDQTKSFETVAGSVLGTFSYMSPEQALGRPVDGRSDLFSLGVVLYEMLTGRLPFEGATVTEVLDRLVHHEPPAIGRFNYDVPASLESVVLKALTKSPDFRYQSARELYIDLHAIRRQIDHADRATSVGGPGSGVRTGSGVAVAGTVGPTTGASPAECCLVAVMAFSNITGEPADDWIGSGIAETVTADLKAVKGVQVVGRAQVFEALRTMGSGSRQVDDRLAIDVGRRLGASWIVTGAYQRLGDLIRITAHFVDVGTGRLLRTVKVDGRIDAIFELQDRIVYELGQHLNLELNDSEVSAIGRDETRSVEAYEAYSLGLMNVRLGTRDSLDRAIGQFERAIAIDAAYAAAWAALGGALNLKGDFLSMPDLRFKAIEALRRAIGLDPTLAQAHQALGAALVWTGRVDEGLLSIEEAVRLDPASAAAHAALARVRWAAQGRLEEGIAALERAVELNPDGGYWFLQLSLLYAITGRFAEAEATARSAVTLQEEFRSGSEGLQIVGAHIRVGYALYRMGRYDEAIAEFERELGFLASGDHALRERTTIEVFQKLSAAYQRHGRTAEADRYFDRAVKAFEARVGRGAEDDATTYYIASLYGLRGDAERASRLLASSLRGRRLLNLVRARIDPDFDPVRDSPAFRTVVGAES